MSEIQLEIGKSYWLRNQALHLPRKIKRKYNGFFIDDEKEMYFPDGRCIELVPGFDLVKEVAT